MTATTTEAYEPTVVSTFAGCGGSSMGYGLAGCKVRLAVEWDDHAARTYRDNFPDTPLHQGDITALSVEEAMDLAGVGVGELDVLDGSPPCQGFSTSGSRKLDDPRNTLFREYARLLEGLQPRAFVMENVSGMVKGKMRVVFAQVLRTLQECGYRVSARLLDARWFGVPQARQRVIFIGVREDLDIEPSHPKGWGPPPTVREAFRDLPENAEPGPDLADLGYWIWCRAKPLKGWGNYHPKGHWFNSVKLDPGRCAHTITKTVSGRGAATVAHYREPRCIGISELKRLFTFPDDFVLTGTFAERWARMGNSVPPLMMKAVAGHVRDNVILASSASKAA